MIHTASNSHPVSHSPRIFPIMPVLITKVDEDLKKLFQKHSKTKGFSEAELLRAIVIDTLRKEPHTESEQPELKPAPGKTEPERITVRMPGFLMDTAKDRAKAKGMAPSRWIAALVQSNLAKKPVMADQELLTLKANIRELTAIGRNINQMARALNESRNNTEKVRLDTLALLDETLKTNLSLIRELVRASQQAWEAD